MALCFAFRQPTETLQPHSAQSAHKSITYRTEDQTLPTFFIKKSEKKFREIMADTGVDIDLYADMESEFPTDFASGDSKELNKSDSILDDSNVAGGSGTEPAGIEGPDLYDDVLTNIKDEQKPNPGVDRGQGLEKSQSGSSLNSSSHDRDNRGGSAPPRRYQVYVGNLTWWTTDADIADAVLSVGVNDFVEVKFYENRANGQSKGFCCVSLATEASMRTLMDKLPKKELHGQTPVVTYATKQALNQFEAQSKTRPTQGPPGGPNSSLGSGGRGPPPGGYRSGLDGSYRSGLDGRPPRSSAPPYGSRPPLLSNPPPRDPLRGPPRHHAPPPGSMPVSMRLPPPHSVGPPPPHVLTGPPPIRHVPGLLPPPHTAAPALPGGAHVNPAFFPPAGGVPGYPPPGAAISEVEFEEIMARNRTVSSSAIARAVQDAAVNDFASSIETLVTAISLIKQSKVAHDDRCRILITSLQDTLHGIESKSYGRSSGRERSRSRERHSHGHSRRRSYSPREREYREHRERHREYYRERSRSREREPREYRERPREDKYYDDGGRSGEYKHSSREHSGSRREEVRESSRSERPRDDIERGSSRREVAPEKERERSRH